MKIKSCPVTIKAAGTQDGTDNGVFEALVATYDVDDVGDQIVPGAFAETLDEWKAAGNPIPVLWSHMSMDPDYHIGVVEQAEERPEGLWVKARLDMDAPKAAQVYRLLKGRRVTQFSFAYDVLAGGPAGEKADGTVDTNAPEIFELRKIKLYEVGPTLIGANQNTDLLDVKHQQQDVEAAATKAGRTLSSKNEGLLREAADRLKTVLASLGDAGSTDDGKATPAPPAPVEEPPAPPAVKTEEPARPGTAPRRQIPGFDALSHELEAVTLTDGNSA